MADIILLLLILVCFILAIRFLSNKKDACTSCPSSSSCSAAKGTSHACQNTKKMLQDVEEALTVHKEK